MNDPDDPAAHGTSDRWEQGNPYARYMGRWSRALAPHFLDWLDVPDGLRWLDVGCGTGALTEAVVARCAPAEVIGVEPSAGFLSIARERLGNRATLVEGHASAIPLPDHAVDVVVSALVLNFVPDPRAGLQELRRVARPDGTIAACVWDYAGRMQMIRTFWDAAVELNPYAKSSDEGVRFPICNPDALVELFAQAGLIGIASTALEIETRFADFDDFWQPFLGGQGPAPAYLMALSEPDRLRLRDRLLERLPVREDGSIVLAARAWAVRGTCDG
jgi:SAM-dependent methyltransferase